jgi:hypothetical protein
MVLVLHLSVPERLEATPGLRITPLGRAGDYFLIFLQVIYQCSDRSKNGLLFPLSKSKRSS